VSEYDPSNSFIALFGSNGAGKTRLLKAIESHVPGGLVEHIGAETMVEEIVAGLRFGSKLLPALNRFQVIDTLLIDNLWILASRPHVTEYISALLKERQKEGLLTVVASDLSVEQWMEKQPALTETLKGSVKVLLS
jgi:chromosomal replication initiation ATPase DnaA